MKKRLFRAAMVAFCAVFATQAFAADVPAVAKLVHEPDLAKLEAALQQSFRSPVAPVRMIAARVAAVRNVTSVLNALRTNLDRETDMDAARETARAVVMLGGLREVDRGLYASKRLGKRLNADVATAAARLGPSALDLYFTTFRAIGVNPIAYFRRALWGQPERASALARQLVDTRDENGLWALYVVTEDEVKDAIDPAVLARAIRLDDRDIVVDAVWYALHRAVLPGAPPVSDHIKQAIASLTIHPDEPALLVGTELLRRTAKLPRRQTQELRSAMQGSRIVAVRLFFISSLAQKLLTDEERALMKFKLPERSTSASAMPFALPSTLPPGVADAVAKSFGCSDNWVGNARVTLDRAGRVLTADVSSVRTTEACRRTLETLLRLSITENQTLDAPLSADAPVLRSRNAGNCFDEPQADLIPSHVTGAHSLRPPRLKTYVPPDYPPGVPRVAGSVRVEVVVSELGCVRTARVIAPAKNAAINDAALLAAARWTFEPATMNTSPFEIATEVVVEFTP